MNDGVKGQTIPPWLGEIANLDIRVPMRCFLGPPQEGFLGWDILLSNNNIWDLEKKKQI